MQIEEKGNGRGAQAAPRGQEPHTGLGTEDTGTKDPGPSSKQMDK